MAKFPGFARFSPFLEALNVLDNTPRANNEFLAVRVRRAPVEARSNRGIPSSSSTSLIRLLTIGCLTLSSFAAALKLPFLALTTM